MNEEDYRQDKIASGVKYQLQAVHTTLAHHYNDTLNFLIRSNTSDITILEVKVLTLLIIDYLYVVFRLFLYLEYMMLFVMMDKITRT